jgi:hypothetical protein
VRGDRGHGPRRPERRGGGCVVVALATPLTFDNDFTGAATRITSLDEVGPSLLRDLSAAR